MTSCIRAALVLSVVGAAALSAQGPPAVPPAGQEIPDVTFRVEVNYVEVDAFVTDAQGDPVTDLTEADFELVEEGRPQKVASFAMVNLPIDRADRPLYAARPVEPDVRSNGTDEGRIYVILLDDLHVHPVRAPRVRAALQQFIEQNFGTNDLAAVVSARGSSADSQDFTNNPRLLLNAIGRFTGKVPFEAPEAALVLGEGQEQPVDPTRLEEAQRARTLMQSIRGMGDFMAGVRGRRKTIILVSEGIGYNVYNSMDLAGGTASGVLEDSEKAVAALTRANVTIYAIDPRGMFDGERLADGAAPDQAPFLRSQDSLRVLAAETGGFAAVNQNDLSNAFDRIVRENSAYYILGYYPTNDRRDGRFRNVEVRVNRPGLTVRSRRGYIAPRGNAPREAAPRNPGTATAAVATALSSPLPVKGVPIRLFAAPFKGAGSGEKALVELAIEFDPSNLGFTEVNGTFNEEVEVMHVATEPGGKVHPRIRHGLKLSFQPETFARARANGVRVLSQMELPPGRYQLRAAVGNKDGASGSVLYDLEVPDFRKARLEMSGLSLASAAMSRVATVRPSGTARASLPGPTTATREFQAGDTVVVYGEVYENVPGAAPHTIDILTELRGEDGRAIASLVQQQASGNRPKDDGYGFTSQLTLNDLAPGRYVIHIEARSNIGDRPTVTRHLQIQVAPAAATCPPNDPSCRVVRGGPELTGAT